MTRHLLPLIIAVAFISGIRSESVAQDGVENRQDNGSPAVALEQEVRLLAAKRGVLWPGFDPLAIPLAVYDGERTFLFRHPSPPQEFIPLSATAPTTHACEGRQEAVVANTNAEIGGVSTATMMLDRPRADQSLADLAAIAIHEAFHVYQRAEHPGWIGNEADLFTYPIDSVDLLALRRLETQALLQALGKEDEAGATCWARQALALRRERYARMDSAFVAYERGTEWHEGLATYVEMRAADRGYVDLSVVEFGPAEVRHRAYATGPALALLLDRFAPEWPAKFEADDGQTLDEALAVAVGPGNACAFGGPAQTRARQKARADIAALGAEQAQKLVAFEGKPGWRVVVESGGSEPLWPQGFDPLNIDRIGAGRLLHTRFLRLGNASGELEVINVEALTNGAGSHPLYQGVRRVVVTGLVKPEVSEAEGKVSVRTTGLTLELKGASITRSGEEIVVRVGS